MSESLDTKVSARELTVAVCGNPNCGKTSLFNALTGMRQHVGNYPGVTVEKTEGFFAVPERPDLQFRLIDTPGSYSLAAFSPDEYIAAQVLCGRITGERCPDAIICVIDAKNLERGLYLLFQVMQVGKPVVVALNMVDIAARHRVRISPGRLSTLLGGIPVIPTVASRNRGLERLRAELVKVADSPGVPALDAYGEPVSSLVTELAAKSNHRSEARHPHQGRHEQDRRRSFPRGQRGRFAGRGRGSHHAMHHGQDRSCGCGRTRAEYMRVLFDLSGPAEAAFIRDEGVPGRMRLEHCRRKVVAAYGSLAVGETNPLSAKANAIATKVTHGHGTGRASRSDKIDRFLLHPFLGPVILVALMIFMFQAIFSWAEPLMNLIDSGVGYVADAVNGLMVPGPLQSLLVDGVIGGVGAVVIFLPQIVILILFIAILEDSGYMPRAAFLVDRLFGWCGLSGKSFLPMLSSFACAVPGIIATRTIENRKLRIMTIMVSPLMSCSARLPVYVIMIAAFIPQRTYLGLFNSQGLVLTSLYLLGLVLAVLISYVLNKTFYRRERATFMMDMPSYALPMPKSILIRVQNRVTSFLTRAGTLILAITIVIWALSYFPHSKTVTEHYAQQNGNLTAQYEAQRDILVAQGESTDELRASYEESLALLANDEAGAHLRNSYFGRMGHFFEPVFRPLGWDWKITMATLASFPAREVIIATLGTIYNLGTEQDETSAPLAEKMRQAVWESGPRAGQPVFAPAVALSIMVFFALSALCGATLVTVKQEAGGTRYAVMVFTYMTILAYVFAFATYQIGSRVGL